MPSSVSYRYASALADSVTVPDFGGDAQGITAQLVNFSGLFTATHELQILFSTPAISAEKKKTVLLKLAPGAGLDPITVNFLNVVIDHERMDILDEIVEAFQLLMNERLGIAVAEITTARPLDEKQKAALGGALSAKTGKDVQLKFSLDPAIIGGVVAQIGSTIYDGSVRGYLARLRTELVSDQQS